MKKEIKLIFSCDVCKKTSSRITENEYDGEFPDGWGALRIYLAEEISLKPEKTTERIFLCSNKCYEKYFKDNFFVQLLEQNRPQFRSIGDESKFENINIMIPKKVGKPG